MRDRVQPPAPPAASSRTSVTPGARSAASVGIVAALLLMTALTAGAQGDTFCWRDNFGRGAGVALADCGPGLERDGALCYPPCEAGFDGVGPVCWSLCPEGYVDDGATCRLPGDIVARQSYGRGAGQPLVCGEGREQHAGLCYAACADGWRGEATACYQDCPPGFRDDGLYCAKPEPYGRGGGYPAWDMAVCERDHGEGNCEFSGALIYPKCRDNYHATGCCICSPDCPPGWEDIGVSCAKPARDRGVGLAVNSCPAGMEKDGALCYPPCRAGFAGVGPVCWSDCPEGYQNDGATCRKDSFVVAKRSVGRGAGEPMVCAEGLQQSGALCYPPCGERSDGIGPVCWGRCPSSMPYDCGAACAVSQDACIQSVRLMLIQGAKMAIDVITFGGSTAADVKDSMDDAAEALAEGVNKAAIEAGTGPGGRLEGTLGGAAVTAASSGGVSGVTSAASAGMRTAVEATFKELLVPFEDIVDFTNMSTYSTVADWSTMLQGAAAEVEGGLTGGHVLALMSLQMSPVERDALISQLATALADEEVTDPFDIVAAIPLTNPFGILDFVDTFRKGSCSEYPDEGSGGLATGAQTGGPTYDPSILGTPENYTYTTLGVLLTGDSRSSGSGVMKMAKEGVDRSEVARLLADEVDPALLAEITKRFESGEIFSPGSATVQGGSGSATATAAPGWQRVDGGLARVSSDDRTVWGVNAGGKIYRRPVDGSGSWEQVCCSLSDVSASGEGWVWGVETGGSVWKCRKPCAADGSGWQRVDGRLVQISGGDSRVWGVTAGGEILRRPVDGSGSWEQVCCSLSDVSASGTGWVWGVQGDSSVWKCRKPCAANGSGWQRVDGTMVQVAGGDTHVWGLDAAGDVWKRPIDGSGSWVGVPGPRITRLSAPGDGWVWGVGDDQAIYRLADGP